MNSNTIATFAAAVVVAFLWNLHRDIAGLRERMARLEGAVDLLAGFLIRPRVRPGQVTMVSPSPRTDRRLK